MPIFNVSIESIETKVEFEVFCSTCGAGLCGLSKTGNTSRRGMSYVEVEPCPNCIDRAVEKSYERGYDEGYNSCIEEQND